MNRHARRKAPTVSRATLYARALQKLWRSEQPNADEARELRRRRHSDGSYPVPVTIRRLAVPENGV